MIECLNPYPAMKDSGVASLGDVPEHWEVSVLRRRLRTYDGLKIGPVGSQLRLDAMSPSGYKVYGQANVIARDFARGTKFVDGRKFRELSACCVEEGDPLVTMMGLGGGALSFLQVRHSASWTLISFVCGSMMALTKRSLPWVDQAPYVRQQILVGGKGAIMHGLNSAIIRNLIVAAPPLSEQRTIVRFLGHAWSRTERYIRAKEKLVALLEEQKQTLVRQAVTGQIDVRTGRRYAAYKASDRDWLGDIPEHWQMVRNGRVFAQRNETGHPELPILEVSSRSGVRLREFGSSGRKQVMSDRGLYKRAAKGDVTYNMMRMWQGAVGVAPTDGLVSPSYVVAKPKPEIDCRYFDHLFRTGVYMTEVDKHSRGIVKDRNRLYWETFKQMSAPCPPSDEQSAIAEAIDRQSATTNACKRNMRSQISLAHEHLTRLVADVTTGEMVGVVWTV